MEVIARKVKKMTIVYAVVLVIGLILVGYGIAALVYSEGRTRSSSISIMILGIVLCAVCFYILIRIMRLPEIIIRREGDTLHFLSCSFKIGELQNVTYRQSHGRGIRYNWGTIILRVNGEELKCNFVSDVIGVHDRLLKLMMENQKREGK